MMGRVPVNLLLLFYADEVPIAYPGYDVLPIGL
ncbi:hypothetical protein FHS10_004720 [Mucilaginibacter dorajii]|nr:hypothetical protein [Mucilaginibacter dorajii]